ncbi:acylneuraminate cytidylyltransferase family protein [Cyclobacteriaceae bacterium]|nr:acylneuraminate cytidylyltransferase family protein [Cyclobacteriaceae bacterium]MDB4316216.1 acylneuraminate cytidylyltransferase family protein [Cyclobacteriaceae bacterium]MDB4605747.1 acylneuraminate cytidylyltransferase family protein [Cyclobacteriaceae bacterium]|tara:strand:+ start:2278 stop:2988 length:711 start_codon:yes stop_codon:yes gene_type:complete
MRALITICARGGSKGIPGKNIRLMNNRPLIDYTIEIANAFAQKVGGDIALSTDDEEIKQIAETFGLRSEYNRPNHLATDDAGKLLVIEDLLVFEESNREIKYDYILDLDVSSPLRNLADLIAAFELISNDPNAQNLFSVNPANRNPYFNMVERQINGYYGLIKKGNFLTRQSSPEVYDLNASFYFFKREFFEGDYLTINDRSMIYIMPHICFDLDHPIDFDFMEYLLNNNKLGFDL